MSDSFTKDFNNMAGKLLISTIPKSDGLNSIFYRSVMLIIQSDGNNVYGVNLANHVMGKIYSGGPEKTFTFLSHRKQEWHDVQNTSFASYLLSHNPDDIPTMQKTKPEEFKKMFFGSAIWSPDQLTEEVNAGYWKVLNATEDLVLETAAEKIYKICARKSGLAFG